MPIVCAAVGLEARLASMILAVRPPRVVVDPLLMLIFERTVCVLASCFTDSRPHLTPFLRQLERATTGVCASRSMCRWTPPVPGPATHTHALGRHHAPTWPARQRKPTSRHGCACMCTARALPCAHLPMPAAGESAHQAGWAPTARDALCLPRPGGALQRHWVPP